MHFQEEPFRLPETRPQKNMLMNPAIAKALCYGTRRRCIRVALHLGASTYCETAVVACLCTFRGCQLLYEDIVVGHRLGVCDGKRKFNGVYNGELGLGQRGWPASLLRDDRVILRRVRGCPRGIAAVWRRVDSHGGLVEGVR